MSRHIINAGRLVGLREYDDGSACITVRRPDGSRMDYDASPATAQRIAADGLLGAEAVVCVGPRETPAEHALAALLAALRAIGAGQTYDLDALVAATGSEATQVVMSVAARLDSLRREADYLAIRCSAALDVLTGLSTWAAAACQGRLDVEEPTSADIASNTLREHAVDVYAALCVAHRSVVAGRAPQREQVVVAEGVLSEVGDRPAFAEIASADNDRLLTAYAPVDSRGDAIRALAPMLFARVRVVVERLDGGGLLSGDKAREGDQQAQGKVDGAGHDSSVGPMTVAREYAE